MQTDTEALLADLDAAAYHHALSKRAAATIREQAARIDRTMSDHGRMLWQDDVTGICASPEMCFEHGEHARCGPCANKQAIAQGIAPDLNQSYSPEVCRLNRELKAARADADRLAEALEYYCCEHIRPNEGPWGVNSQDFGATARAALAACTDPAPDQAPPPEGSGA